MKSIEKSEERIKLEEVAHLAYVLKIADKLAWNDYCIQTDWLEKIKLKERMKVYQELCQWLTTGTPPDGILSDVNDEMQDKIKKAT